MHNSVPQPGPAGSPDHQQICSDLFRRRAERRGHITAADERFRFQACLLRRINQTLPTLYRISARRLSHSKDNLPPNHVQISLQLFAEAHWIGRRNRL